MLFKYFTKLLVEQSTSWSSSNAFVFETVDPKSNLWQFRLDIRLLTARHRFSISSKKVELLPGAMTRKWAPPTCYTLERNTAGLVIVILFYLPRQVL